MKKNNAMQLVTRRVIAVLTFVAMAVGVVLGEMTLPLKDAGLIGEVSAAGATDREDDDDLNGRFRVRFRDGANYDSATNVHGGFYTGSFELHLFATVGGVPDPSATIHYTTSGNTSARGDAGGSGLVNANPSAGSVFTRAVSGQTIGHTALTRYDGGVRPYTWDNNTRRVSGIPSGIPSFTGGSGSLNVSLEAARSAFTVSAVASRVVGGVTEYSETITRTFVRGPSGSAAASWADNEFLILSLYSDAKGIFDYDEGIFNCGID
ncbi:MAG: hypothetical protein FWD35_06425, partial [Oscillospiraceae bacterium]|nr:hypothetical protein [Oscillospiraceae bacterium]